MKLEDRWRIETIIACSVVFDPSKPAENYNSPHSVYSFS